MKRSYPHGVFLGVACIGLLAGCGKKREEAPAPAPAIAVAPVVRVMQAVREEASVPDPTIAVLEGSASTEIRAPASGYLVRQNYQEEAFVKKGDVLFEIDARPGMNPGPENPAATKITAPTDGIGGRAVPGSGDLVRQGELMTTVSKIDPIRAVFEEPVGYYVDLANRSNGSLGRTEARPEKFEIVMSDGTTYRVQGDLDLKDIKQSHVSSKTITTAALFSNPAHTLVPGEYVRIRHVSPKTEETVRILASSVNAMPTGDRVVMIVRPDNTVEIRRVSVSYEQGIIWDIVSGIQPGERVVVDGSRDLQPGTPVTPQAYAPAGP
jgi:multidrug efflux pump subunit AcrA (membrane-fusion protein)